VEHARLQSNTAEPHTTQGENSLDRLTYSAPELIRVASANDLLQGFGDKSIDDYTDSYHAVGQ
jgi:hypothetical protein